MDYVVTVPKKIPWEDYVAELVFAEQHQATLFFKIPPKVNVEVGGRCYMLWNGAIRGWMEIVAVHDKSSMFECQYTGKRWEPGRYLERKPPFHNINPIPMKGFRGIRKLGYP